MAFSFEAVVIFLITVAIITGNILILLVLFQTEQLTQVNKYFFASLTISDLCVGVFVTPFCVFPTFYDRWIYGSHFCHIEAYLVALFWIASIYSLTWISIDHYVAVRKPDRYESVMTRTRCVCWVAFIWLASTCFCCPTLFGVAQAQYYKESFICVIDWKLQKAYLVTSGLLVIAPPFVALTISNLYLFTHNYKQQRVLYDKSLESHTRPEAYFMNFVICLVYVISWFPWCLLQFVEGVTADSAENGKGDDGPIYKAPTALHFYLTWLAVGNSFWKFIVYILLNHDFRIGLKILHSRTVCSRWHSTS